MDTRRESGLWFNRLLNDPQYATPNNDVRNVASLLERIDALGPQIVQIPELGPLFYSGPYPPPQEGHHYSKEEIREHLEAWRGCIQQIHERGAKAVGVFSFCYHFGDLNRRLGWFDFWDNLWDEELLGPQPDVDPTTLFQRSQNGQPIELNKEGMMPGKVYYGCPNNPAWRQTLKAMLKVAIDLGIDGFNVGFNFRNICRCPFCREELKQYFGKYPPQTLREKFGIADLEDPAWLNFTADTSKPGDLGAGYPFRVPQSALEWLGLEARRCQHHWEKTRFDEIFLDYGRSLKPDLILCEWFHFNFTAPNERSLLSRDLWAKGEDYIWYCHFRGPTNLQEGHVADSTLGAKYCRAMGRGKPFLVNTYDTRYRVGVADQVAGGGIAWGVHKPPVHEDDIQELSTYFRFLREQEPYYHPATSYADVALVYADQAMQLGDAPRLRTLQRLGRRLIDGHVPFDIVVDADLSPEILKPYRLLILPNLKYLSTRQVETIRAFVQCGGSLIATDETACSDQDGTALPKCMLEEVYGTRVNGEISLNEFGKGACLYIPEVPQDERNPGGGCKDDIPPSPAADAFGQDFLRRLQELAEPLLLQTTASWRVEITPYIQQAQSRLVLHMVNYNRDESAPREVPIPERDIQVSVRLPENSSTADVRLLSPDRNAEESLPFKQDGMYVRFMVPEVLAYNLAVVDMR